ncbi:MAG: hypothetical protein AB7H88_01585 [Vicinamibacterales bacterium]
MAVDRRTLLVGALGTVAVMALAWNIWGGTAAAPVAATARRTAAARPAAAVNTAPIEVRLGALQAARETPEGLTRNPFRFGAARRPEPGGGGAGPVPAAEPSRPATFQPPRPAGPPPPAPIGLKFFGLVERSDGERVAALSDGRTVWYGREGDIIEGRYRIVSIGVESIEMTYVDGTGRQTIRLSGQ